MRWATHDPAHMPLPDDWPRNDPEPKLRESLPEPAALWSPLTTRTETAPFGLTRPLTEASLP